MILCGHTWIKAVREQANGVQACISRSSRSSLTGSESLRRPKFLVGFTPNLLKVSFWSRAYTLFYAGKEPPCVASTFVYARHTCFTRQVAIGLKL